ncbi:MAG: hypothetical protein ACOC10_10555 [Bacteroidota bacterium]
MEITVEISYFPLVEDYQQPVNDFIGALEKYTMISKESGVMSSILTGPYEEVMKMVHHEMKPLMEKYPSVFTLKISNSCHTCRKGNY